MIAYYDDGDKAVALHYAHKLDDKEALKILEAGQVTNTEEARALSHFYWAMLNESVKDDKSGKPPFEGLKHIMEGLLNAFTIHLGNLGLDTIFDDVMDERE